MNIQPEVILHVQGDSKSVTHICSELRSQESIETKTIDTAAHTKSDSEVIIAIVSLIVSSIPAIDVLFNWIKNVHEKKPKIIIKVTVGKRTYLLPGNKRDRIATLTAIRKEITKYYEL